MQPGSCRLTNYDYYQIHRSFMQTAYLEASVFSESFPRPLGKRASLQASRKNTRINDRALQRHDSIIRVSLNPARQIYCGAHEEEGSLVL
jgi:hypothetical protein